ncbi:hypothetical protein MTO96_040939, partial [Rhipicephalus appendiculatus]
MSEISQGDSTSPPTTLKPTPSSSRPRSGMSDLGGARVTRPNIIRNMTGPGDKIPASPRTRARTNIK